MLMHMRVWKNPDRNMKSIRIHAYDPGHEKMCPMSYVNNTDADQPVHPRSLINAFVVRCLV